MPGDKRAGVLRTAGFAAQVQNGPLLSLGFDVPALPVPVARKAVSGRQGTRVLGS
jgi:hypothetical protein